MPTSDQEAIRIRKEHALALAQLVYDVYAEEQANDKKEGQNHADQPNDD